LTSGRSSALALLVARSAYGEHPPVVGAVAAFGLVGVLLPVATAFITGVLRQRTSRRREQAASAPSRVSAWRRRTARLHRLKHVPAIS
jgi:hypothetical protein